MFLKKIFLLCNEAAGKKLSADTDTNQAYMRLQQILTIAIVLFFNGILAAQADSCDFKIAGRTFDLSTKEPLPFVNVRIEGTGIGTVSDEEGFFTIEGLCEKEHDLVFSFIGYKTVTHHHDFHHPFLEIYLAVDRVQLEGVVVEAERSRSGLSSASSVKLTSEELAAVSSESLGDVASQIAGVTTISTGQNIVKPVIHGLHSNRVLIINNGLRHEFQEWGSEHAPEIDPSLVDELEVVKGASTVRFGPEALGGVILLNPPKMELSTPLRGKVQVVGKSNGQSGEGTVELRKGFKWFSLLAGGSYVKQGDLRAPNYNLTNTGKEERSYYGGFRIHPLPELDIEGHYSHFEQELGILSGSVFGNLDDLQRAIERDTPFFTMPFSYDIDPPKQEVAHDLYKAKVSYVGDNQAITAQYGYQFNRRQEFGVRRSDAPNIDLELVTESVDVDWRHPSIGNVSGKFGFQWQRQANDNQPGTNTVPFIPNYDSESIGVYLIETLEWDQHTLELGARYDYMDAFITGREPDNTIYRNTIVYDNLTATLGYKRQFNRYESFRTNFGTAWRAPNVAELYRFGQHAFFIEYGLWRYTVDERFDFISTSEGILDENDRAVPPEVGYKWINTYEINRPDFQAEFTGYINYIENFIYSRPAGLTRTPRGFFVYFIYEQTDALFWGLDVSARLRHTPKLASTLKGSYLWSKQITEDDNFAEQPPAQLTYDLGYQPDIAFLENTKLQLSLSYTFEQWQHPRIIPVEEFINANQNGINRFTEDASDFDIIAPPPGYFLANFSWRSSYKKFEWQFQIRNLLNTSYRNYTDRLRYFADEMGRNFVLSLTYRIAG